MRMWKVVIAAAVFGALLLYGMNSVDQVMRQQNPWMEDRPAFALYSEGVTFFGKQYDWPDKKEGGWRWQEILP
ncbi:MAG: hypothetical protein ACOX7F_08865 [Eubacteriales bacterium]|jgi:hypothetical protein